MTKARRPNSFLIAALKRRYGLAKGALEVADLFTDQVEHREAMGHLGAVILMIEPTTDLAAIRAIRPYQARKGYWSRDAFDILRTANRPLRTYELARMVMARNDIAYNDRAALFSIGCSLQAVLARQAREGTVRHFGKPRRWIVAKD
jgi:hypothetical protein